MSGWEYIPLGLSVLALWLHFWVQGKRALEEEQARHQEEIYRLTHRPPRQEENLASMYRKAIKRAGIYDEPAQVPYAKLVNGILTIEKPEQTEQEKWDADYAEALKELNKK